MEAVKSHDSADICGEDCPLYNYSADPELERYQPDNFQRCSLDQSKQAEKLYTPLEDWQIRVLALHPGSGDASLTGDLHVAAHRADGGVVLLEERRWVDYEALSYCWGEPCFDSEFQCKDNSYPITRNLHAALWHLRKQKEVRYLWIDALCINQYDFHERSSQVAKMLSIYKRASEVIVWLGEGGPNTSVVSAYARYIRPAGNLRYPDQTTKELVTALPDNLHRVLCKGTSKLWCKGHAHAFVSGLHDLLTRPWYERLWVVQEAWAARDVTFTCGSHGIKWSTFNDLAKIAQKSLESADPTFRSPLIKFEKFTKVGSRHKGPYSPPLASESDLLRLLAQVSGSKCSNPRDHIYAVLGMSNATTGLTDPKSDAGKIGIHIDYERSIREVYVDVVKFYLQRDGDFKMFEDMFLARTGINGKALMSGQVGGEELPSWCPNWSVPFALHPTPLEHFRPLVDFEMLPKRWEIRKSSVLCLRGKILCRVGRVEKLQTKDHPRRDIKVYYENVYELERSEDAGNDIGSPSPGDCPYYFYSPTQARPGDYVGIFATARAPLVIREHQCASYYTLVGMILDMEDKYGYKDFYEQFYMSAKSLEEFELL